MVLHQGALAVHQALAALAFYDRNEVASNKIKGCFRGEKAVLLGTYSCFFGMTLMWTDRGSFLECGFASHLVQLNLATKRMLQNTSKVSPIGLACFDPRIEAITRNNNS